jgi:hypothetical protein
MQDTKLKRLVTKRQKFQLCLRSVELKYTLSFKFLIGRQWELARTKKIIQLQAQGYTQSLAQHKYSIDFDKLKSQHKYSIDFDNLKI